MMFMETSLLVLHLLGAMGFVLVCVYGRPTERLRLLSRGWFGLWARDAPPHWSGLHFGCPWCFGVWGGALYVVPLALRVWLPSWIARLHFACSFAFTVSLIGFFIAAMVGAIDRANERLKKP